MFKHFPYPTYRQIRHIIAVWAIETAALLLLAVWLPGLQIHSGESALYAVAIIGLLNAILRPLVLTFTITITVFSLGMFSFLINVVCVLMAVQIVPGFIIQNDPTAILVVLWLTLINMLVSQILSLDENDSYYRSVIRRLTRTQSRDNSPAKRGLIIIQFDGLSKSILESAINAGFMPTLAELQINEGYHLEAWQSGLPSQTSASQLGIIYGNNYDVPAFRWYEKENQRLIVSNHVSNTAYIESRVEKIDSLLSHNASSIGNMFSGNAQKSALTMSQLTTVGQISKRSGVFYNFFLNPYNFTRTFFLMTAEVIREVYQNLIQILRNKQPRIRRTFLFALERALSVVFLREVTTHIILEDMFAGFNTIYATFIGYDVVSHHTGINSPAALSVLRGLDKQIQRIVKANQLVPSSYSILLISDHGQSQGVPFQKLFGLRFEQLLEKYIRNDLSVVSAGSSKEVKGYINSLLQEALNPHQQINKSMKRIYKQLKSEKKDYSYFDIPPVISTEARDIIVCPSGNMALVYFPEYLQRLSFEQISILYPDLLANLVAHPGIGFVLTNSSESGAVVIHAGGIQYLSSDKKMGQDILQKYPPHISVQLQKINGYPHSGDLIIFSKYDPETQQCAAFEDLLGHHGGIGGLQTEAFVFYPKQFVWDSPIFDSTQLHQRIRTWQNQIQ